MKGEEVFLTEILDSFNIVLIDCNFNYYKSRYDKTCGNVKQALQK